MRDLVPVVDIGGWDGGDEAHRAGVAAQVDAGARAVGFLQIAGHGVATAQVEAMLDAADHIFALPPEAKAALIPPPHINRGYAPVGSESLTYSLGVDSPPDLFEAFNIGPEQVPVDDPIYVAQVDGVFVPNIWPADLVSEREALVSYFAAVADLARRLTRIFAVALGMPEDFFVDKTDHSTDTLRLNNYVRASGTGPRPGQVRMGAHTDYGIVTVLYGDRVPGLEIVAPDGEWTSVVPEEGLFLVNLGDLLAQWTNDRWRSTVHRVVPPEGDGPARRRSAAFFHDGNYDARIECLPTCCSDTDPPRYPPVVVGEHLRAKLLGPRTLTASDAISTAGARVNAVIRGV